MDTAKQAVGLVGLAVMGENLALNIADKGFSIAVYNRSTDKVDSFLQRAAREGTKNVVGTRSPEEFVASLERPRRIIMMVKAGQPVDDTIAKLAPLLEPGDLLVDGGNEHFSVTERRAAALKDRGISYLGMGVSGGEEGARNGPSIMPGGPREAYEHLSPVLKKIAAQIEGADGGPCVTYIGPGGSGHYVKMVHNGIEYGDMQLIAEAYDLLKHLGGLSNAELAEVFSAWNQTELQSFLIEITARIFRTPDPESSGELVDKVLDASGMKGTGKWTVLDAVELGVPIPVIASSVDARVLSSQKESRRRNSAILRGPAPTETLAVDAETKRRLIDDVRQALYCAKACSYAQGMKLLSTASQVRGWNLPFGEIAAIWRGGCIIRAQFLGRIKAAFDRDARLDNLLLDPSFVEELAQRQEAWRRLLGSAAKAGISTLAMSAALSYYDSIRRENLPANLIQAQRDLFGAHTYERKDRPGTFHSEWAR
jgi:6-phosphogluconate dehydrogenase